jgi:hypothetical protein
LNGERLALNCGRDGSMADFSTLSHTIFLLVATDSSMGKSKQQ